MTMKFIASLLFFCSLFTECLAEDVVDDSSLMMGLIAIGLDSEDAIYLVTTQREEVISVLEDEDRFFKGIPKLKDDNFVDLKTAPRIGGYFKDRKITHWTRKNKMRFQKMFGRLVFAVNSSKFKKAFAKNIYLLDKKYQGNVKDKHFPAARYPHSYDEFKNHANNTIKKYHGRYKFFITKKSVGVARGMSGLALSIETGMLEPRKGSEHNYEALLFHELTHTWDYQHVNKHGETLLQPNNIPYYTQFILGTNADNPSAKMKWETPNAILEIYFGHSL